MEKRELVCICCPLGCMMTVDVQDNKAVSVTGNTCPRGAAYAEKEVTDPRRIVTSTVRVKGIKNVMISVKTESDIPKDAIMDCMEILRGVQAEAPVRIGDVIVRNIVGTGVDVVATKNYN